MTGIASQKYNEAHIKVGEFICAEEGLSFTKNTTEAINMVASGMIEEVSQDNYKLAVGYERFEAGTPNIAGGIGLGRAVDYLKEVGMDNIKSHESRLTKKLLEGLSELENVHVYGSTNLKDRIGVVSFNINGVNPHDVLETVEEITKVV